VQVLVWNGTLDQSKRDGDGALSRAVRLRVAGLPSGPYRVSHHRVDGERSNVVRAWQELGAPDWPDSAGWAALRARDHLEELEPPRMVEPVRQEIAFDFDLPMPGASLVRLSL
jgi:xylan 1,4-beta-xylosidase